MSTRKKKTPTTRPAPDTTDPTHAAAAAPAGEPGTPALGTDTEKAVWAVLGDNPGFTIDELAGAAGISASTTRRILTGWESVGTARSHRNAENPRAAKTWTTAEPTTSAEPAAPEPADTAPADMGAPDAAEPVEPAADDATEPETGSAPAESDATNRPDSGTAPADPGPDAALPESAPAAPTADETAVPSTDGPAPTPDAAAGGPETTERLASGALRGLVEQWLHDHAGEEFTPHQIGKALGRSAGAVHNALVSLTKSEISRQTCAAPKRFALAED
ncbi:hypothetical protein [Nocardia sp. SC052]|uniref:hypothetical protein n=1 Tax=Nocardia sichangensis TaxID=3385975 RepID=UPI0039A1A3AE